MIICLVFFFVPVKQATAGGQSCGIPASVLEIFNCTFWIYSTKDITSKSPASNYAQKLAEKCFNLKNDTFSITTNEAETATTETLTNAEGATSVPSESETETTQ